MNNDNNDLKLICLAAMAMCRAGCATAFEHRDFGYVHMHGVVSERFQKRFHLFYRFDALFTRTKGKYFQCIELAPTSAVNC